MSKSLAVIETPNNCSQCPFHYYSYSEDMDLICLVSGKNYGPVIENEMIKRPVNCPLLHGISIGIDTGVGDKTGIAIVTHKDDVKEVIYSGTLEPGSEELIIIDELLEKMS